MKEIYTALICKASAVDEGETSLRRQTSTPELDFLILPLSVATEHWIWDAVSKVDHLADDGVIHTQIEKAGRLAFGAYDNFHSDCVGGVMRCRDVCLRG